LHHAGKELIFLHELLEGLRFPMPNSTVLHCDNNSARQLTEDHSNHTNVKHIHIKYYTICDILEEELGRIIRVSSIENTADIFTKPLTKQPFEYLRHNLGLHPT
jgi:radical SAM superfamily enzyme with C-terminal helix-hairpin-helix motif